MPKKRKYIIKNKNVYKQKFRDAWKKSFDWLEKREDRENKMWCRYCKQFLQGSKTLLERHARTSKHQVNYKNLVGVPKIDKCFENCHPVGEKNF
jgi:hypothetical protein